MIRYAKGSEPKCLRYVRSVTSNWNSVGNEERKEIRAAVVRDQSGLCAYCQRRIRVPPRDLKEVDGLDALDDGVPVSPDESVDMRIEHWDARSQPGGPGGPSFVWNNLLGCCCGWIGPQRLTDLSEEQRAGIAANRYAERWVETCDRARGNTSLWLSPIEGRGPSPEQYIRYGGDGEATSDDPRAVRDIATLKLNAIPLVKARAGLLDGLRLKFEKGGLPAIRELYKRHQVGAGVKAPEYAAFVRYYLARWLRRYSSVQSK